MVERGEPRPRDDAWKACTVGSAAERDEENFVKKQRAGISRPKTMVSQTMKSAFDNKDLYVLTDQGTQFVHYAMNELVPRVSFSDKAFTSEAASAEESEFRRAG